MSYKYNVLNLYRPPFGPPVLKPGLDLRVSHLQTLGQSCPLGAGQVLLPVKAFLQLADLDSGKRGSRLFPFGRSPVLIRVSYPTRNGKRYQSRCRGKKNKREASQVWKHFSLRLKFDHEGQIWGSDTFTHIKHSWENFPNKFGQREKQYQWEERKQSWGFELYISNSGNKVTAGLLSS